MYQSRFRFLFVFWVWWLVSVVSAQYNIDLRNQDGDIRFLGQGTQDYLGRSMATGDVNGDGIHDLLIGAYGATTTDGKLTGKAYLFFGRKNWSSRFNLISAAANVTILGDKKGDCVGFSVAIGDVNGDGLGDMIIGAYSADPLNVPAGGIVYIIFGATTLPTTIDLHTQNANVTIRGDFANGLFGFPVATGDINGDSLTDLICSAHTAAGSVNRNNAGCVFVFYGRTQWPASITAASTTADIMVTGANNEDKLGRAIAAGDLNADKYEDLIMGAYKADPLGRSDAGIIYVILGAANLTRNYDLRSKKPPLTIYGAQAGSSFGVAAAAGDLNGDGLADLAAGALYESVGTKTGAGKVYVIHGRQTFNQTTIDLGTQAADRVIYGQNQGDNFGISIAMSDFNGNQFTDLFLGASNALVPVTLRPGQAYIIFGQRAALAIQDLAQTPANVTITGPNDKDSFGWFVTAGDINADNVADCIVGADLADPENRTEAGEVHVIFGNAKPATPNILAPEIDAFLSQPPTFVWEYPTDLNDENLYFKLILKNESTQDSLIFDSSINNSLFVVETPGGTGPRQVKSIFTIQPALTHATRYQWYVLAYDGKEYSVPAGKRSFTMDYLPPELQHSPPASVLLGQALQLAATVTDELSGVKTVALFYRQSGDSLFKTMPLLFLGGSTYQINISGLEISAKGLEYYFDTQDKASNRLLAAPERGYYAIPIRVTGDGLTYKLPTSGTPSAIQSAYRLVSIPLRLEQSQLAQVLEDDLGQYDNHLWRLFDYRTASYVEYPDSAAFTPGKSYFLITKESGKTLDSGEGITISTQSPFAILLNPGWNLIGNPFNFNIRHAYLQRSSAQQLTLFTYRGEWLNAATIQPWEGYALFNMDAQTDTLWIQPGFVMPSRFAKSSHQTQHDWSLQIEVAGMNVRDGFNFAGVAGQAALGWDVLDQAEPPAIGDFVSLSFYHPEWQVRTAQFCTDFQPPQPSGNTWHFRLRTNMKNANFTLDFKRISTLPPALGVQLLNQNTQQTFDLRSQSTLELRVNDPADVLDFTLRVAPLTHLQSPAPILPARFELQQNYPNPLSLADAATRTCIEYAVSQPGSISLKVYNLLGEHVATLILNQMSTAGRFQIHWDGRDQRGQPVANGIYFYQLQFNQGQITRKMVVVHD